MLLICVALTPATASADGFLSSIFNRDSSKPLKNVANQSMIRRLGRKWKTLHKLVYAILLLTVLHFLWQVKADYLEASIYAIIAAVLLLHRVGPVRRLKLKSFTAAR